MSLSTNTIKMSIINFTAMMSMTGLLFGNPSLEGCKSKEISPKMTATFL